MLALICIRQVIEIITFFINPISIRLTDEPYLIENIRENQI